MPVTGYGNRTASDDGPYAEVDSLLDRLHQRHMCGCSSDCGSVHMQGGKNKEGSWLRMTMPDGYTMEYIGRTVNECAWKLSRALTDYETKPPPVLKVK